MNIRQAIIESFAKWLIGGAAFAALKRMVLDIAPANNLTGAEKRDAVLNEFAGLGYSLAGSLVNTGLELALVWAKQR